MRNILIVDWHRLTGGMLGSQDLVVGCTGTLDTVVEWASLVAHWPVDSCSHDVSSSSKAQMES